MLTHAEEPETPPTTTAAPAEESTTTEASQPATTTTASSTTASTSAGGASSAPEAPAAENAGSPGLSKAAQIGIGVGVGAVALALLAVAACVFIRNRRKQHAPSSPGDRFKISHPMPNPEHDNTYNRGNSADYDFDASELEAKSQRYEDMLPRQQPRQMV